ncbi:MAG: hypothetical protein IPK79_08385 [Vampirovibrionales bacterium]|nr:hypothetical protein [Vampirovibrionales bacterium]
MNEARLPAGYYGVEVKAIPETGAWVSAQGPNGDIQQYLSLQATIFMTPQVESQNPAPPVKIAARVVYGPGECPTLVTGADLKELDCIAFRAAGKES